MLPALDASSLFDAVGRGPDWKTWWPAANWFFPVRRLVADGLRARNEVIERVRGLVSGQASVYRGRPTRR